MSGWLRAFSRSFSALLPDGAARCSPTDWRRISLDQRKGVIAVLFTNYFAQQPPQQADGSPVVGDFRLFGHGATNFSG
jgi:hypothetical protein